MRFVSKTNQKRISDNPKNRSHEPPKALVEVVVGRRVELSVVVLVGKLLFGAGSGRQWEAGGSGGI